jgi:hypothetical protein
MTTRVLEDNPAWRAEPNKALAAAERAALTVCARTQAGRIDGPPARHSAADSVRWHSVVQLNC